MTQINIPVYLSNFPFILFSYSTFDENIKWFGEILKFKIFENYQ